MRYFIYALCMMVVGCATDTESTEDSTDAKAVEEPASSDVQATPDNPNTVENMTWTFLVNGIFHNNATITAGQSPKDNPNLGAWIDFKENGTYEYGTWGEKLYDGTWFYDGESELLELTPGDGAANPSQWRVMHKENSLIWVGTAKYANNATQMRWLRREGYPEK